jgi:nucleotide-binding universal stress UspA family protein
MKKILVPIDFSENALKAARYAGMLAEKSGAALSFFHAFEDVTNLVQQPFSLGEKYFEEIRNARSRDLEEFRRKLAAEYSSVVTETALEQGSAVDAILHFAERCNPDLIVMGTKGASGMKEILIGSIAAGVIGQSRWPVLTIPDEYEKGIIDAIVVATNRFEKNTALLKPVIDIATIFSATVHVVVFVDTDTAVAVDYTSNNWELNNYADALKKAFPSVSFKAELIDGKEFEPTVDNYYKSKEADIIAMLTYHKNIWERIWKRSVTKKMAYHSKIPILAIPVL